MRVTLLVACNGLLNNVDAGVTHIKHFANGLMHKSLIVTAVCNINIPDDNLPAIRLWDCVFLAGHRFDARIFSFKGLKPDKRGMEEIEPGNIGSIARWNTSSIIDGNICSNTGPWTPRAGHELTSIRYTYASNRLMVVHHSENKCIYCNDALLLILPSRRCRPCSPSQGARSKTAAFQCSNLAIQLRTLGLQLLSFVELCFAVHLTGQLCLSGLYLRLFAGFLKWACCDSHTCCNAHTAAGLHH